MGAVYSQSLKPIKDLLSQKKDIDYLPSTFEVASANSGIVPGQIGSYTFARYSRNTAINIGQIVSGSLLQYYDSTYISLGFSGSWKLMGKALNSYDYIFLRVA